ncbi:MAG: hypothetical protein NVSMB51_14280 [Solirubrobacteraceae bacterium]
MLRFGPLGIVLAIARAALATREHWRAVEPEDRARLRELVAKSKGRRSRLSDAERAELRDLVAQLHLGRLLWRLLTSAIGLRRARRERGKRSAS